jgi:hypothetical protein
VPSVVRIKKTTEDTEHTELTHPIFFETDRIAFLGVLSVLRGSNQQTTEDTEHTELTHPIFFERDRIAFLSVLSVLRGSNQENHRGHENS